MAYAIMRTAKMRGAGSIAASMKHVYREKEVPNANPEKTPENEVLTQYNEEKCRGDIDRGRTRADNVEMIEVVLTTSPEWQQQATTDQKDDWKQESQKWLEDTFGKDNVQSVVLHKDEQTDHIHAHITPIDEKGRLNAKHWLGGKEKLQKLQDAYHKVMEKLGLERGERGSKARHQEVSQYYGRVKEVAELGQPKITGIPAPSGLVFSKDEVKEHGLNFGRHVLSQLQEREKIFVSTIAELEAELKANKGNVIKNNRLTEELEKSKSYEKRYNKIGELAKINPNIIKEITKALEMQREIKEREWLKKSPQDRINDINKKLQKVTDPVKRQELINKRIAATQEINQNRKQDLGHKRTNRSQTQGIER